MAAEKLLTEAACKAAKPKSGIYYLNDGAGLRMRIRPDGSRTWIFRYRLGGKEMSTGLGPYPAITLQIARAKALEARSIATKGINPSVEKRSQKPSKHLRAKIHLAQSHKNGLTIIKATGAPPI